MVSLLANIGILFLAVYFCLKSGRLGANQDHTTKSGLIGCILMEVLLGTILLSFSTVILGWPYRMYFNGSAVRHDFIEFFHGYLGDQI